MTWQKKGVIFNTNNQFDWMVSHACTPTVHILNEDVFRIFFSPRNEKGQSMVAYVDVAADNPKNILDISSRPIMSLGKRGTFDDGGIMPCNIAQNDGKLYLYYVGWNPSVSVAYRNAIGLAVSENDGETFERLFDGAIVDRNMNEPYFTASPAVMKEGDIWHMWYSSSTGFVEALGKIEPVYIIKYAQSTDGIHWRRDNVTCIKPKDKFEANARPTVIKEDGIYKMWYCYRGSVDFRDGPQAYRIGYAESEDAINWTRKDDEAGISYSKTGWDSTMQTYPNVIKHKGKKYLFYNGNGFGATGFGYAIEK
ncbi:hypothetical protein GCM10009117_04650 [Gangjinia marincola]|uniref:Uncharacterized protein n=1 Tax=Gangjinia marincola TaxID=578463 RepID=A0ABN1MDZ0_9FLAO